MSAVKKSKGLVSFEIEVERARTERRWSSVFGMLKKRPKGFNQGLLHYIYNYKQTVDMYSQDKSHINKCTCSEQVGGNY